jgi:dCMP deaminase
VVCQQVTTKIAYLLSKGRTKFIADRLMLSNLVFNEFSKRPDTFDYIGALKDAGPVILITFHGDKDFLTARRKKMDRPVMDNPVELYDKWSAELVKHIPVCVLEVSDAYEINLQKALDFINTQETKLRESNKQSLDSMFMEIAEIVATRSTCLRRHVGAVLVKSNMVVSTGYNGSPRHLKHCSEVGCVRMEKHIASGDHVELCRGAHAEANAIIQAAQNNVSTNGTVMYCTCLPCAFCAKVMINAGVTRLVYKREYNDVFGKELLEDAGVKVEKAC